jgi:hypothetical protein
VCTYYHRHLEAVQSAITGEVDMAEVTVQVMKNGPLLVKGPVILLDGQGQPMPVAQETVALCRCGQSKNKPLCDGTHRQVGFQG